MTPPPQDAKPPLESATTFFLLRILKDEIARDGGACLVTTLKEYIIDGSSGHNKPLEVRPQISEEKQERSCHKSKKRRNQQLNSLLTHSNVGKPKLLAFLESHPDVFEVDRNSTPHWVTLVEMPTTQNSTPIVDAHRETLRTKVFQKALYVLRQREARIARRRKNNPGALNPIHEQTDTGVFCHWLLRQCAWELHFLLRYCGYYSSCYRTPSDVKQVASREWEEVALNVFEKLLRAGREDASGHLAMISWIKVKEGKALLQQLCSEKEYQRQFKANNNNDGSDVRFDFIVRPLEVAKETDIANNLCEEEKEENTWKNDGKDEDETILSLVRQIDQSLTEIVCEKDGGHQVSLMLILHRYPHFKELLGGRDLWSLYCDYSDSDQEATRSNDEKNPPCFFQSISMFYNGANLILRSKRSKTIDGKDDSNWEKRMMVDEEGLYSVTNNKWGRAMSNLVIQACRQKNLFGEQQDYADNEKEREAQHENEEMPESSSPKTSTTRTVRTMIDLTASVGGMTLALAKSSYFDRVIALEIDQGRAEMCRENLNRHGFCAAAGTTTSNPCTNNTIIEVRNQDSVEQIPFLPRRVCFVIDPPWGGYDYKEKVRRQQKEEGRPQLKLGDTSLEDILAMISLHNSPCVVGLRLPTNFPAIDFLQALRENHERVEFECLTRRKISVQLFVVLYFPASAGLDG